MPRDDRPRRGRPLVREPVRRAKGWRPYAIDDLPIRREKPKLCPACGVYGAHRWECAARVTSQSAKLNI